MLWWGCGRARMYNVSIQTDQHIINPSFGDTWKTSIGRVVYIRFAPASADTIRLAATIPISIDGHHHVYVNGVLRSNIGGLDFQAMMTSLNECEYVGNLSAT